LLLPNKSKDPPRPAEIEYLIIDKAEVVDLFSGEEFIAANDLCFCDDD
jgi:hypothetical protein